MEKKSSNPIVFDNFKALIENFYISKLQDTNVSYKEYITVLIMDLTAMVNNMLVFCENLGLKTDAEEFVEKSQPKELLLGKHFINFIVKKIKEGEIK